MIRVFLFALLVWVTTAEAEQRRALSAHEHGRGQLNLAIEGNELLIELVAPGMDIVGFEHVATDVADREAIDQAVTILMTPITLFQIPPTAGCVGEDAEVMAPGQSDEDHRDAHDAHDSHQKDELEESEDHSEFRATYHYVCEDTQALTQMDIGYFGAFPAARELGVAIISDRGATSSTVRPGDTRIDLEGMQ